MRKLAAAVLAVPVVALLYVPVLLRRSIVARVGLAVGVGALLGVGANGLVQPVRTVATPPLPPIVAVPDEAFTSTIAAGVDLHLPVQLTFSEPMDRTSVARLLRVTPTTALDQAWDASGTVLTVRPATRWVPGTYHTISIQAGALAATGRPMSTAVHAAFVTRSATTGTIEATELAGEAARLTTGFRMTFDRPVDIASLRGAFRISPDVEGRIVATPRDATTFLFEPATPLVAGTVYEVSLVGLVDASGVMVQDRLAYAIATTPAPEVVRFRPTHRDADVARSANLSVRFSEPMERASTKRAFVVTADGKPVAGSVRFAENDTVLVFDPTDLLPYGAEIQLLAGDGALSATGTPLEAARSIRFRVEAKPRPAAPAPSTGGGGGGGSVGSGSWSAVENYYLKLMNCTRTGGTVTSTGGCSSPGGRNVAPLWIDSGITTKVARPYAKMLATTNQCSHFIGGNPGDRLRAAGYTSYIWAENLGCRSGDPYAAVLGSHLYFQSERNWSPQGGHYVNLMNSAYDRVGIGVWVSGGRVRLVVDFYHPR